MILIYSLAPVLQRLPLAQEFFLNYLRKVRFLFFTLFVVRLFATPETAACQTSLSFTRHPPWFAQILVHLVGDAI